MKKDAKIQCPVCLKWKKSLMHGYRVTAIIDGEESHGDVACKPCVKAYNSRVDNINRGVRQ